MEATFRLVSASALHLLREVVLGRISEEWLASLLPGILLAPVLRSWRVGLRACPGAVHRLFHGRVIPSAWGDSGYSIMNTREKLEKLAHGGEDLTSAPPASPPDTAPPRSTAEAARADEEQNNER